MEEVFPEIMLERRPVVRTDLLLKLELTQTQKMTLNEQVVSEHEDPIPRNEEFDHQPVLPLNQELAHG
eukprot:4698182-Amphidinium_carterae.1